MADVIPAFGIAAREQRRLDSTESTLPNGDERSGARGWETGASALVGATHALPSVPITRLMAALPTRKVPCIGGCRMLGRIGYSVATRRDGEHVSWSPSSSEMLSYLDHVKSYEAHR